MSLVTGYVDVLIRKLAHGYAIVGLSPAGIEWVEGNHINPRTVVTRAHASALIPLITSSKLSVELSDGSVVKRTYSAAYERRNERREP
jgi:hypothetical protein